MRANHLVVFLAAAISFGLTSYAIDKPATAHDEAEHGHEEKGEHKENEKSHDEKEGHEAKHDHEGAEGHEDEEGGAAVGPDKGIVEASEQEGFKLSPEAFKNFDLKMVKLSSKGPWSIPKAAIVRSGEEVNLFRYRNGFFKRIDFKTNGKSEPQITISSSELKADDEIAVSGLGFLRVAELAAFGGVSSGHAH